MNQKDAQIAEEQTKQEEIKTMQTNKIPSQSWDFFVALNAFEEESLTINDIFCYPIKKEGFMNGFEEFMHFLQGTMKTPTWFGWYHLLWLCIMVTECVMIYIFRKRISQKTVSRILLCTGIVLVLFEVYKQLINSFKYNGGNGNSYWNFEWYAFPFQFCSTPMYLMVLAGCLKDGKVRDALLSYLATYAIFAGLAVMIYPGDVFTTRIGINIQTMVWHSSMVVIGFLILATNSIKKENKTVAKATVVFVIMLALAMAMNTLWHFYGTDATFNMFYISPWFRCKLPILGTIYSNAPYVVFLLIYILGFMLVAYIMLWIAMGFDKLEKFCRHKKMTKDEIVTEKIIEIIKNN